MALIKCPECGKQISDKSKVCIGCGYPIGEVVAEMTEMNINGNHVNIRDLVEKHSSKVSAIKEVMEKTGASLEEAKKAVESVYFLKNDDKKQTAPKSPHTICPECGAYNPTGTFTCRKCRHRYTTEEYKVIVPEEKPKTKFNGVYRYTYTGGKQEVYCPRCGSSNCNVTTEEVVLRDGKTKSTTSLNLNPLKPFTIFNHKEKVVRKPITKQVSKFTCNDCGKIFN